MKNGAVFGETTFDGETIWIYTGTVWHPFLAMEKCLGHVFLPGKERCVWCNVHFYHLPSLSQAGGGSGIPLPQEDNVKLESWHSSDDKRHWKIVRTDNYTDVPGEIVAAEEATGECSLNVGGETKTLSFGPGGIRIVRRAR